MIGATNRLKLEPGPFFYRLLRTAALSTLALLASPALLAQEQEPNDACLAAQALGAPALPAALIGSLDSTVDQPDIDFFRLEVGVARLAVTMGPASQTPPVEHASIGVFDSDCHFIRRSAFSDSDTASVEVAVPADGVVVVAATVVEDFDFTGGGAGHYRLDLVEGPEPYTVSGRVVDAETTAPVPFATTRLLHCESPKSPCNLFDVTSAGADGGFAFPSGEFLALIPGHYMASAEAPGYGATTRPRFELVARGETDIGDIVLTPLDAIGSIRGRLVDEATGQPIPGDRPPFGQVELQTCREHFGCIAERPPLPADEFGQFRYDPRADFLEPGTYRLVARSDEHAPITTEPFTVAADEHRQLGRLRLRHAAAATFDDVVPCADLPATGGTCSFSYRVSNRLEGVLRGSTWVMAGTGNAVVGVSFQPHPAERLVLSPGGSAVVTIDFTVPASLPADATVCVEAHFGAGAAHYYEPVASQQLFCLGRTAAGFRVLAPAAGRLLRR